MLIPNQNHAYHVTLLAISVETNPKFAHPAYRLHQTLNILTRLPPLACLHAHRIHIYKQIPVSYVIL